MATLQFQTLSSSIHTSFWQELSKRKLEIFKLSTEPVSITGRIQLANDARLPSTIEISSNSFSEMNTTTTSSYEYTVPGKLHIVNTLEEYKTCDKRAMLNQAAIKIWNNLNPASTNNSENKNNPSENESNLSNPSDACEFFILVHADLKKHKFLYWFCFPGIQLKDMQPITYTLPEENNATVPSAPSSLSVTINNALKTYETNKDNNINLLRPCCILTSTNAIQTLNEYLNSNANQQGPKEGSSASVSLLYYDPCPLTTSPGWTLRNILTSLIIQKNFPRSISIHCLRFANMSKKRPYTVQSFDVQLPTRSNSDSNTDSNIDALQEVTGLVASWETDRKNRPRPRLADLSSSMDPRNLARVSVDLNVKLMRWRMLPELNTMMLQQTKCLLLGAGTLGCNVARCLMGWGVRNITFVDNGKVSYSNPVRQSLFRFENCANGGIPKAEAAAAELKRIFPDVNSVGISMNIHMPGHTVMKKDMENVSKECIELENLIMKHDVIYLLTDTRESRWLPTMLAAKHDKMVINCALGFDSFLVMRHGAPDLVNSGNGGNKDGNKGEEKTSSSTTAAADSAAPGAAASTSTSDSSASLVSASKERLGCYFCQDIVAPGDSTRDRTLDQQCTVTRPGLALIAGALSVELMVGLLHHPLKHRAPADDSKPVFEACESRLGLLPHQIRGYLTHYQNIVTHGPAFQQCTACSPVIRQEYDQNGFSFLHQVFNDSGKYLENLSGVTELTKDAENIDLDDFAMSDDEDW